MIKETKIQTEVVERHKFCDVCGAEIQIRLMCSKAKCEYCKKDLCEDCIGHEGDSVGDYRTVWCKRCWMIGAPYRVYIDTMAERIECEYNEWRKRCEVPRASVEWFVRGRTFTLYGIARDAIVLARDDEKMWWVWTTSDVNVKCDPIIDIIERCLSVGSIDYDLLEIVEDNGCEAPTETQC